MDEVTDYQELDVAKAGGTEELAGIDPEKYLFVRKTFDEEFQKLKKDNPDWSDTQPEDVRGAYFSHRKTFKKIAQDEEIIHEILTDKGKLLSFASPHALHIYPFSAGGRMG